MAPSQTICIHISCVHSILLSLFFLSSPSHHPRQAVRRQRHSRHRQLCFVGLWCRRLPGTHRHLGAVRHSLPPLLNFDERHPEPSQKWTINYPSFFFFPHRKIYLKTYTTCYRNLYCVASPKTKHTASIHQGNSVEFNKTLFTKEIKTPW